MTTQKEIQEGIRIELENSGDIQLAEVMARRNLCDDPNYYRKMNASGLREETEVAIINKPNSPNATSPQAKLSSSDIGVKPCEMKPLKSDRLKAPETKIDNITNQGRTPPDQPMPSLVDLSGNPIDTTSATIKPNSVVLTKTPIPVVHTPQPVDPTNIFGNKISKALKDEIPRRREMISITGVAESINEGGAFLKKKVDDFGGVSSSEYHAGLTSDMVPGHRWTIKAFDTKKANKDETPAIKEMLMKELIFKNNAGIMEIFKFFDIATEEQRNEFDRLASSNQQKSAWDLVQKVLGVTLMGKGPWNPEGN
jgi:hypothetical protein